MRLLKLKGKERAGLEVRGLGNLGVCRLKLVADIRQLARAMLKLWGGTLASRLNGAGKELSAGRSYQSEGAINRNKPSAGRSYRCIDAWWRQEHFSCDSYYIYLCMGTAGAFLWSLLLFLPYTVASGRGRSGKELLVKHHLVVEGALLWSLLPLFLRPVSPTGSQTWVD